MKIKILEPIGVNAYDCFLYENNCQAYYWRGNTAAIIMSRKLSQSPLFDALRDILCIDIDIYSTTHINKIKVYCKIKSSKFLHKLILIEE